MKYRLITILAVVTAICLTFGLAHHIGMTIVVGLLVLTARELAQFGRDLQRPLEGSL
jgi:hypothetical protein